MTDKKGIKIKKTIASAKISITEAPPTVAVFVVKIQRPIFATDESAILACNKDNTVIFELSDNEELLVQLFGEKFKTYWMIAMHFENDEPKDLLFLQELDEEDWPEW